jgi:hypothetical protein
MTNETPIACSLGTAELPRRLAQMTEIGSQALLSVSPDGTMHFRNDDATRERLAGIVAAEAECCSFLRFELGQSAGELVLSIHAPEGAEPIVRELVEAFAAEAGLTRLSA